MKLSKKLISVVLALTMIMSAVSVCFTSLAALNGATEDEWQALYSALQNNYVKNANYNIPDRTGSDSKGYVYKMSVVDNANGDIAKAYEAFRTVFNKVLEVGANHSNGFRCTTQVKDAIATKLQGYSATTFENYNMATVLNAFVANCEVATNDDVGSSYQSSLPDKTIEISIMPDANAILMNAATVADAKTALAYNVYSIKNERSSRKEGSGCNQKTYYYAVVKDPMTSTAKTAADVSTLEALETEVNNYSAFFGYTTVAEVLGDANRDAAYTALKAKRTAAVNALGEAVVNHFFPTVPAVIQLIEDAGKVAQYEGLCAQIMAYVTDPANDYNANAFTADELQSMYNTISQLYKEYNAISDAVKAVLIETGKIDINVVDAYVTPLRREIELAKLAALKPQIDAAMAEYASYSEETIVAGDVTGDMLALAISVMNGYVKSLNTYAPANVAEVCGETYLADVTAFAAALSALTEFAEADAYFKAQCAKYAELAYGNIDVEASTEDMMAKIAETEEALVGLELLCEEIDERVGSVAADKIYGTLKAALESKLAARYDLLGARSAAQINTAYDAYQSVLGLYGDKVSMTSIGSYRALKDVLATVDTALYEYLDNAAVYDIDADVAAKYAVLMSGILADYEAFVAANGLNVYEPSKIDDIVRPYDENKDIARDDDYTVTDEKVEEIIALLDRALGSNEVKDLLGVDLSALIKSLPEMLYTDDMMNTIVGFLFPMITDLAIPLLTTMIPSEIDIPNDDNESIPGIVKGKHVIIKLPALLTIAQNAGFNLFPVQLEAPVRAAGFTAAADALKLATTAPSFTADKVNGEWAKDEDGNYVNAVLNNPWYDASVYKTVLDEDGNPVLDDEGNEVKKVSLEWGIEGKDDFVNALAAVLGWLEPALASILGDDYTIIRRNLSTTKKTIVIEKVAKIIFDIDFDINTLHAVLKLGKDGHGANLYANVLVPVFELLGVSGDKIADKDTFKVTTEKSDDVYLGVSSKNYQTTKDMLYAILDPVEDIVNRLAASPIDFITELLPNLTYALESGAVTNLLSQMLEITLDVKLGTPADKSGAVDASGIGLGSLWGALGVEPKDLYEAFGLDMFIDGFTSPMTLNIYDLIKGIEVGGEDDKTALGDLLSGLNNVLGLVSGLVGINLPKIDTATLSTLGEVKWNKTKRNAKAYEYGDADKAAYIEANKADVLLFVLNYVFTALSDPDFLPSILDLVNADKEEPVELPEIVNQIISNIVNNPDNAIAAITELVFPQEYTMPEITWRDPIEDETTETLIDEDGNEYVVVNSLVEYSEFWTKDKAVYVAENLPTFIDNILTFSGLEIDGTRINSLSVLVETLIGKLYTADTANKLLDLIKGLLGGLDIDESLMSTLSALVLDPNGIDLGAWDKIKPYDFKDGDKAAFTAAVVEMLKPLTPVLNFILSDKDLLVKLTDSKGDFTLVTANGYDGYSFGLVPLLEALDADVMTTTAFIADSENTVENLVTMLLSAVDKIAANPYDQVFAILPNVLYFIASDGVTVAVDSLLFSVNVLLDTIRPIYDINIYELIDFDIRFAETDPIAFLFSFVAAKLEEATGSDFDIDFTADDLCDSLAFGDRTKYTSANGKDAYKIKLNDMSKADMLTVILRYVLRQFVFSENATVYADLAKEQFNLDDNTYAFLYSVLFTMRYLSEEHPDYALGILFWVFYGADTAADAVSDYYKYFDYNWAELIKTLGDKDIPAADKAVYIMTQVYKSSFRDIYDEYLSETAKKVAKKLGNVKDEINEKLAAIPGFIDGKFDDFFSDVTDKINQGIGDAEDKIEEVDNKVTNIFERLIAKLKAIFQKIMDIFKF